MTEEEFQKEIEDTSADFTGSVNITHLGCLGRYSINEGKKLTLYCVGLNGSSQSSKVTAIIYGKGEQTVEVTYEPQTFDIDWDTRCSFIINVSETSKTGDDYLMFKGYK